MPVPHTLPTTPTGASKHRDSIASMNSPVRWIPPSSSNGNIMLPSSPSSSSFVVPPRGLRKGEKRFSNIRVVARIRPLSEKEKELGYTMSTITPLLPDPLSPSPCNFSNEESKTVAALAARFDSPRGSPISRRNGIPGSISSPTLPGSHNITPVAKNTSLSKPNLEYFAFSSPTTPKMGTRISRIQPPSPSMNNPLRNKNYPPVQNVQSLEIGVSSMKKRFDYDVVFEPDSSQQEVYEQSIGDAVRCNIFRGYNTTIIAYGQTGSGKTHTMTGPRSQEQDKEQDKENHSPVIPMTSTPRSKRKSLACFNGLQKLAKINGSPLLETSTKEKETAIMEKNEFETKNTQSDYDYDDSSNTQLTCNDGIIPRAINDLFVAKQRNATGGDVTIRMTYLEIYNDEIYDLLDESRDSEVKRSLRDHGENGVFIKDLTSVKVTSQHHANVLMRAAAKRRKTGSNALNKCSSRSHSICTLHVTISPALRKSVTTGKLANFTSTDIISAKLTLVDLAGSERLKETKVEDGSKKESININKDLFVLGKVISTLAEKSSQEKEVNLTNKRTSRSKHIPYRDCKLTRILRDSLGGNCCTVMVACLSPAENHIDESVNTLRYAERTRSITNVIKRNVAAKLLTPAECAALRRENKVLKKKLTQLTRILMLLEKEKPKFERGQACVDDIDRSDHNQTKTPAESAHISSSNVINKQELHDTQKDIVFHVQDNWRQRYDNLAKLCENIGVSIERSGDIHADDSSSVSVQSLKRQIEHALATYKSDCYEDDTISTCSRSSTIASHDLFTKNHNEACNVDCDETISTFQTDWTDDDTISTSTTGRHSIESDIGNKQMIKDRLEDEIFGLEERVAGLKVKQESMGCELKEIIEKKTSIEKENETMLKDFKEKQLELLNLIQEKELRFQKVEKELIDMDKSTEEKKRIKKSQEQYLDREINEKQDFLNKLVRFADNIGHDISLLEKERIDLMAEVDNLEVVDDLLSKLSLEEHRRAQCEDEVQKLRDELEKSKKESSSLVEDLRHELEKSKMENWDSKNQLCDTYNSNIFEGKMVDASPARITSISFYNDLKELEKKQDVAEDVGSKKIQQVEMEVKKLWAILEKIEYEKQDSQVETNSNNYFMTPSLAALVKRIEREKQAKMFIESTEKEARDFLSNNSYLTPPRSIRRNIPESKDDISLMTPITVSKVIPEYHDIGDDCSSVLFQDEIMNRSSSSSICSDTDKSLNSEQRAIRSHAHKMLFWANKVIQRKDFNSSNSSITLSVESNSDFYLGTAHSCIIAHTPPPLPPKRQFREQMVRANVQDEGGILLDGDQIISNSSSDEERESKLTAGEMKTKCPLPPRSQPREQMANEHIQGKGDESLDGDQFVSSSSSDDESDSKPIVGEIKTKCTCSSSMFSGNEEHMEFFLPKLGLHCSCGSVNESESYTWNDQKSLTNILRPWQVDFLKSQGISSIEKFVKYHRRNSKKLAVALKYWRVKKNMKPARTKSCMIALHIWSRTAKTICKSITEQRSGDNGVNPKINFTEIPVDNFYRGDADSVATSANNSVNLIVNADECEI